MWTLKLSKQAQKFCHLLHAKQLERIEHAFERIAEDPYQGKMLHGELKGYWSYRVGTYRIIYQIEQKEILVEVLRIQHRKEVYERFRS